MEFGILWKKNCWYHKTTANCQPSHSFKGFHSKRTPCSTRWMVKLYTPLETQYPENYSRHGKRFCYRIFSFGGAKNEMRAKQRKRGRRRKHWQANAEILKIPLTSERGAWLARLVKHYWHQSIKVWFMLRGCDMHINFLRSLFLDLPSWALTLCKYRCCGSKIKTFKTSPLQSFLLGKWKR